MKKLIEQNSKSKIDQTKYNKQYEKNTEKLSKLENTRLGCRVKRQKTLYLLNEIKLQDGLITGFDVQLLYALIEKVIVNRDGRMEFEFKNGQEINI